MAEVIRKAVNKFNKGLVMDFSPENTQNELLTHALNATLLTFNGNELSLQNDMGNARVETAFLPEGYMPVGTCEYGGIIYIVSYNPLEDKSQIGCFPSPERNVSNKELGESDVYIKNSDFQNPDGSLVNTSKYVLLKNGKLNPGDKFLVCSEATIYDEKLEGLLRGDETKKYEPVDNPILALNIVSIEDSGKIVYLNSDVLRYNVTHNSSNYNYHILGTMKDNKQENVDIDSYRNTLSSGYSVFKSKTSGKLALLAELVMIDSYSVTHSLRPTLDQNNNIKEGEFDVIIHSEIEPKITESNYTSIPKLKYYFLKKSQGYIQAIKDELNQIPLFSTEFEKTKLNDVFVPTIGPNAEIEAELNKKLVDVGKFDFNKSNTYHARLIDGNVADFIPIQGENVSYPDIKLAHVKIPEFISKNGLDLPFKYDYTLVPCMNYGKLEHLAVSNTVDFSKLHDFNKSDFTTWKYHIDDNQLRLTFGAEIFDTYETDKVDALVLEFYDCWGFAGSITISDKKSYSGNFTKIISLNTTAALSTKKINSTSSFKRNINISQDVENKFIFKNLSVEFDKNGWKYTEDNEYLSDADNDCGVLYSNILYGVKTYLRRTINKGDLETEHYEYIRKKDMFLYTLPIYNDYYYNTDDFTTLLNPKLNLVLTYRLEDSSTIENYETQIGQISKNYIEKGYCSKDLVFVNKYLEGSLTDLADTEVIKYYKYSGTSKLNLEIGLQKEYQDIGLSYSPELNKYFKCTLSLISNESKDSTFSIKSKVSNSEEALQYINKNNKLQTDINKIAFDSSNQNITVSGKEFRALNFINPSPELESDYIPINYEFVVGYKAHITNIRATEVPATTVCALFHSNGEDYNYEDFGIYKKVAQDDINDVKYLSNAAFYNEGSKNLSIFGICRQLKAEENGAISTHWQSIDSIETEAVKITTPLRFNTGESLKYLTPHIGKYAFCQPYVPTISDQYNANLYVNDSNPNSLIIRLDKTTINSAYKEYPRYSLVLNTYSSVILSSEFISTIHYDINDDTRIYSWFTGLDIETFNRKLLKTMSSVYVYNPDYDSLKVNLGDVVVVDNEVQFVSNLISTDSYLELPDNKTLNDYIYFGTMQVSEYLRNLESHSMNFDPNSDPKFDPNSGIVSSIDGKPLAQVTFEPSYLYCGTSDSNYLISTLNYNTPKPEEFENELTFKTMSGIVVKHANGSINLVSGKLNKNALYGFSTNNCLVQLDVSNYTIEGNGSLTIGDEIYAGEQSVSVVMPNQSILGDYIRDIQFVDSDGTISLISGKLNFSNGSCYEDYLILEDLNGSVNHNIITTPTLDFGNSKEYSAELVSVEVEKCTGAILHADDWGIDKMCDVDQTLVTKFELATKKSGEIRVQIGKNSGFITTDGYIKTNIEEISTHVENPKYTIENGNLKVWIDQPYENDYGIIYAIKIKNLTFKITKTIDISKRKDTVINGVKTKKYSDIIDDEYTVSKYDVQLRGTSLTLNDLYYDPSNSNHRLFVREGLVSNITTGTNKLYFRKDTGKFDGADINCILLQTGPCFTIDNL